MFNKLCLCVKGNKSVCAPLKGVFTGKSNEVPRHTFIKFISPDIKWRTFNKVHKNMVRFNCQAQKSLNNIRTLIITSL